MARSNSRPEPLHPVWITLAMAREYERRGAFVELRPERAALSKPNGWMYSVDTKTLRRVMEDAEIQYENRAELPRGIAKSYSALSQAIRQQLGLSKAPGASDDEPVSLRSPAREQPSRPLPENFISLENHEQQIQDCYSRLPVGASVFADGLPARVIKPYGMYVVRCKDGDYISDNDLVDCKPGYVVVVQGRTGTTFYPAHEVVDRANPTAPSYLRIARDSAA